VADLYLMSAPITYVDITDTADRNIAALHSHVSQSRTHRRSSNRFRHRAPSWPRGPGCRRATLPQGSCASLRKTVTNAPTLEACRPELPPPVLSSKGSLGLRYPPELQERAVRMVSDLLAEQTASGSGWPPG